MSIVTDTRGEEWRSLENPLSPQWDMPTWRTDAFGFGYQAASGVIVTRDTALNYAAVWRAVNIVSASVAKTPLRVYRWQQGETPIVAREHPAYRPLCRKANEFMTPFTMKQTMTAHVLLLGNAYLYVERNGDYEPIGLLPLMPDTTWPIRVNGRLMYVAQIETGSGAREFMRLPADDVLHFKGMSYDGLVGYSVISKAKDSLGLGMAAGQYAARFYNNNATPSAVIEVPGAMPEPAQREFLRQWNAMHQGLDNSHRAALITNGGKLNPLSFSASDAQILETRRFEIREVALWFGLPPHLLGDDSRTSYNSLEQENQSYLDHTLDPWFVMIEEECQDKLLTEEQKRDSTHYIAFDRSEVVRADTSTLTTTLVSQVNNGLRNPDEARAKLNLPGYPNGEGQKFRQPANIGFVGQSPTPQTSAVATAVNRPRAKSAIPAGPSPAASSNAGGGAGDSRNQRLQAAERALLTATFERAFKRLTVSVSRAREEPGRLPDLVERLVTQQDALAAIVSAPLRSVWASAGRYDDPTPDVVEALLECARSEGRTLADECRGRELVAGLDRLSARWQSAYPGELAAELVGAVHGLTTFEIRYSPDQPRGPDGRWISAGTSPKDRKQMWKDAHDQRAERAKAASEKAQQTGKKSDHAKAAAAQAKAAEAATQAGRHAQAKAHSEKGAEHSAKAEQAQRPKPAKPEASKSTKAGKSPTAPRTTKQRAYDRAAARAKQASQEAKQAGTVRGHQAAIAEHQRAADAASMAKLSQAASEHEAAIREHYRASSAAAVRATEGAASQAVAQFDRSYRPPPAPRSAGKGADIDALHQALYQHERPLERARVGVEAAGAALHEADQHFKAAESRVSQAATRWEEHMRSGNSDPKAYRAAVNELAAANRDLNLAAGVCHALRGATGNAVSRMLAVDGKAGKIEFQNLSPSTAPPQHKGESGRASYDPAGPELLQRVDVAHQWLADKVHDSTTGGRHQVVIAQISDKSPFEDQRAFAEAAHYHNDGRPRIALTNVSPTATAIHEYGHAIEDRNAEVHSHMLAFLRDRCGNEPPTNLNAKFGRFRPTEEGRKDDFEKTFNPDKNPTKAAAYYVGKDYHGQATEVLSMGLQKMYEDPGHFARSDPQFFKMVLGVMHGHLAGRK